MRLARFLGFPIPANYFVMRGTKFQGFPIPSQSSCDELGKVTACRQSLLNATLHYCIWTEILPKTADQYQRQLPCRFMTTTCRTDRMNPLVLILSYSSVNILSWLTFIHYLIICNLREFLYNLTIQWNTDSICSGVWFLCGFQFLCSY